MGSDPYNPENKNHPSDRNWAGIRNAPEEKRDAGWMKKQVRPEEWPPMDLIQPARTPSGTDYGRIPFALYINGSRFAEGTATVEKNEARFHLEDAAHLKRYIAAGVFDGATLSIDFIPAVPKDDNAER